METISFLVHGKSATNLSSDASHDFLKELPGAQVKQSVKVGTLRGTDAGVVVTAEIGKDVVVVHIADGPSLMLHPETAKALLEAQQGAQPPARGGPAATFLQVPAALAWDRKDTPVQQRGFLGDRVLVAGFDLLTNVAEDSADDVAAGLIVKKVDGQVDQGVYALNAGQLLPLKEAGGKLAQVPARADGGPLLVLIHGTFSSTHGTFGKLWEQHPDLVADLFDNYGKVYALDHPTLGESPINNALLLARTLPQGARLHLLTHSRGGLVAEVLARACSIDRPAGADLDMFAGAAYARDLADLTALVALVRQRDIRVDRVVRVACPARGTLLASNRLDAYISTVKWGLELAGIPVLPALVGFLGDVAQHKSDPATIPGLAAMMPHSPLVNWVHAVDKPINGELRVVAGDVQGTSVGSWIKTLLTDAFFWTDNDFVVQTSSMYGGAPRVAAASFLLDKGGAVSHFTYFSNPKTATAVVAALTETDTPAGFGVIGPLSAKGEQSGGTRGAPRAPDPSRPAVFILPGIMGSNLKVGGDRIWVGPGMFRGMDRLKYGAPDGPEVVPDGAVGLAYSRLAQFLSATHEVIEFAYDWRKPIEEEALRLSLAVTRELDLREKSKQPVRLLAHSMGGLVARVMQLKQPAVWTRMIARNGASVVMLGTPNGGSWAPMQMLSGDDTFGNVLVAFMAPFRDGDARATVAGFPGLLQMQAGLLDPEHALGQESTWRRLADKDIEIVKQYSPWHNTLLQIQSFAWGVPPQSVLDQAVKLRKELDAQRDRGDLSKLTMVVGNAKFTPDGFSFKQEEGLMYLEMPDHGDGTVTLASALLPGVPAWKVDCQHGWLGAHDSAFNGYLQLLETGTTSLLGRMLDPAAEQEKQPERGKLVANRAARRAPSGPPTVIEQLDSDAGRALDDDVASAPLALTVVNGNLKFVRHPVLLGHYHSSLLTGAEEAMDKMIGGSMSACIRMGLYPDAVRTHQIFVNLGEDEANPLQMPRPEAVIVVGLGAEGELTAAALTSTVCNGVIAWAQRQAEIHLAGQASFELCAALIGSGGPGISAGQAARSIALGVSEANAHLLASHWPHVSHLYLTEMYLDRATDAWRALGIMQESMPRLFRVSEQIVNGTGAHRRALDTGYRGARYDLLSAISQEVDGKRDAMIVYSLDTKRAREEVRAQRLQGPLVKMLLKNAADGGSNDRQLGRTLFKLLVPPEVEPFLAGSGEMQIVLDEGTAGIPWEMLDTDAGQEGSAGKDRAGAPELPWAIRVKLLRRLRTTAPAAQTKDAGTEGAVLVIGEPNCAPKNCVRLPGAWQEASAVAEIFRQKRPDVRLKTLISKDQDTVGFDAPEIINTVFDGEWRIVHIAGHGEPRGKDNKGGIVLSGGTFLSADEIASMRVVPALVFLNCCHSGKLDPAALLRPEALGAERPGRPAEAATLAQELINKGVRCVIVAGWAVSDDTAQLFATTFYARLLAGRRFIDAVGEARAAAWQHDKDGKTWGAYQCYGDPDWHWITPSGSQPGEGQSLQDEFGGIGTAPALVLALETVIVKARYQDEKADDCVKKVEHLERRFATAWGDVGVVAEAFGLAWAEARNLRQAIKWNRKAIAANDGSASIGAMEQLGNMLALTAWEEIRAVQDDETETDPKRRKLALDQVVATASAYLNEARSLLEQLNDIRRNPERLSLVASALKRVAMVEITQGHTKKGILAVTQMRQYYIDAETLAKENGSKDWFYPGLNRIAAEVVTYLNAPIKKAFASENIESVRRCIEDHIHNDPDFQSVAAQIQLRFYLALANKGVRKELPAILAQFDDLFIRAKAPRYWNSVRDQLDFVLLLCQDVVAKDERKACEELRLRLRKIAPPQPYFWTPSTYPEDVTA